MRSDKRTQMLYNPKDMLSFKCYLKDNFYMDDFNKSRLDKRIRQMHGKHIPQSVIEKALRNKDILLNGLKANASDRCSESDEIFIHPAICRMFAKINDTCPSKHQIRDYSGYINRFKDMIIYEDEDLIIVNKPAGLATQLGTKTKLALDVMAKAYHSEARLVHRIDKETSGIVVLVKSVEMSRYMLHMFQKRQVHKKYLAVVSGVFDVPKGIIDKPLIKRKEHVFVDFKDGKKATTLFKVVKILNENRTLIEVTPLTGRTHQIRVHMGSIGHPIVGDTKYGGQKAERLFLHASSIELKTKSGVSLKMKAKTPDCFCPDG